MLWHSSQVSHRKVLQSHQFINNKNLVIGAHLINALCFVWKKRRSFEDNILPISSKKTPSRIKSSLLQL
jgi:hypothetical protein